jgi:hypothetical protein
MCRCSRANSSRYQADRCFAKSDLDRANAAVNHEASALRAVIFLSRAFRGGPDATMRGLIARHIRDAQALGLFASAVAVCIVLIAANDRPFAGQLGVRPTALLQVRPDSLPASPGFH